MPDLTVGQFIDKYIYDNINIKIINANNTIETFIVKLNIVQNIIMLTTLFITHAIIDSRIPVKAIMKFKQISDE